MVDALQYLTLSRPDIAFAINKARQFMRSLTDVLWCAVKTDFAVFQMYSVLWCPFHSPVLLQAYLDADWASCVDERRSTGGFAIFLGTNFVPWRTVASRV